MTMPLLTRRHALGLLGAGTGAGLASLAGFGARTLGASAQCGIAQSLTFPQGAVVRTLLGDLPPERLSGGATLFHEHLSINIAQGGGPHYTDDVDLMIEEARAAARDGVACIVDGGHPDMRRSLAALRRIATESGLPIVASGGYYMQRTYPPDIAAKSAEQIADELAREASLDRLGAFGEIGQQGAVLTADEQKVFRAIGLAQVRTGLPIFTHNAYTGRRTPAQLVPPDAGLRQLDILEAAGAQPAHVVIGHVCCLHDPKGEIAVQIAKRGAFVGFDRVTLNAIMPDADRVIMAMALIEAGHADQLLLSSDFYSQAALKRNGGPGLAQTATVFGPMLLKAGLPEAALRRILVDNPRRFLAVVPKA
jgi:phosphotriesterase-related protein